MPEIPQATKTKDKDHSARRSEVDEVLEATLETPGRWERAPIDEWGSGTVLWGTEAESAECGSRIRSRLNNQYEGCKYRTSGLGIILKIPRTTVLCLDWSEF